jgi:hypothetical protein
MRVTNGLKSPKSIYSNTHLYNFLVVDPLK